MKKIIGVTGGTGAGKSSLCKLMAEMGAMVIDADKIAHNVIKRGGAAFDETVSAFGADILNSDGEIDRKALGKVVFSDSEKLKLLNQITHKHIFEEMRREIENADCEILLLDVPLLFADDFTIDYDLSIAVTAELDVRVGRISSRDKITESAARARISAQMSEREMAELADICVDNSRGIGELKAKAERIYNIIKT